jgi:predicted flavoprotein YhiN
VKRTTTHFINFAQETPSNGLKTRCGAKIEDDGRMFVSNSSQTIIDCFLQATTKLGIKVLTGQSVQSIFKKENVWKIETQNENYISEN